MNAHHHHLLEEIKIHSGKPTKHTFLDAYLGNNHPRYAIDSPTLRALAKTWAKANRDVTARELQAVLTSLIKGKSATEKCMAGILLDACTPEQRKFDPASFNSWLEHLMGWAEIDTLCTGQYSITEIPANWTTWKKLLEQFSKSKNINKRRASIVLLCSTLRNHADKKFVALALANVERLKSEKDILITKAISWVLRSGIKHNKKIIADYVAKNKDSLPKIAVRETMTVLKTGTKTKANGSKETVKKNLT